MQKAQAESETTGGERGYRILLYGIESMGLVAPVEETKSKNFELVFEPFDTSRRFSEFDGLIVFQRTFESYEWRQAHYRPPYLVHRYEKDELDKRHKELEGLLKKGGFACFILCHPFLDREDGHDFRSTDLAKRYLNFQSFYRNDYSRRTTDVASKRDEFRKFIEIYGAANSYFTDHNRNLDLRVIAEAGYQTVGMVLFDKLFFVPSLTPPGDKPDRLSEFFHLLAEAVTSTFNKLISEVPPWADGFQFSEEKGLTERRTKILKEAENIEKRIRCLRDFKRVLLGSGDSLVDTVLSALRTGFGFQVDSDDRLREDFKPHCRWVPITV